MMTCARDKVIFIVGPTATGKTVLSVDLAKRIKSEIISADSMQVYKGMAVLSQAPAKAVKRSVRHHLVEILNPSKEYSAASFSKRAARIIESLAKKGRIPIVVGGSGLYVKALVDGLFPSPPGDAKFRRRMERFASKNGCAALHKKLSAIDAESANKIHPNDKRRIIRALEIYHSTGKTMTELKSDTRGIADSYDVRIFGLKKPRPLLYSDINARVERMFRSGMVNEVKKLAKKRLSKTAAAALGLKEILACLGGEYDIAAAKELVERNTRRFAKRQITWFRADKRIRWFDVSKLSVKEIIGRIIKETDGTRTVGNS